jgi:hypothetical protein
MNKNIQKKVRKTLKKEFRRKCSALGETVPMFYLVQTNIRRLAQKLRKFCKI